MGSESFEVGDSYKDQNRKKKTNRRLVYLVAFLCVAVVVLLILTIVYATRDCSSDSITSTTSTSTPQVTSSISSGQSTTTPGMQSTTPIGMTTAAVPEMTLEEKSRIDCYPEARERPDDFIVGEQTCKNRGCEYSPSSTPGVPPCYVSSASDMGLGYSSSMSDVLSDDDQGMRVRLTRQASSRRKRSSSLDWPNVIFEVTYHGENIVRFKLYPENATRYEVPDDIVHMNLPGRGSSRTRQNRYKVFLNFTESFSFQIIRQSSGAVLWDTSVGGLVLRDQFLSISTRLASHNVYGFGENGHTTFRHDMNFKTWGLFARDQWVDNQDSNQYSVHPFYTVLEDEGNSHGVLILNSNAMDYTFSPLPMLTYRTIGGILDMYMFLGPSPENVVQQYTGVVGRPYMIPYWSLGFQLCRYGYNNLENMQAAVNRTLDIDFPLDVQYADIDTYDVRKVFTLNEVNFAGLPAYFAELRSKGIRTITILDPTFIVNETDYEPHDLAMANDIYIKWPDKQSMPLDDFLATNSTTMIGFVWPEGKVGFPDFFLERTNQIWEKLIVEHFGRIEFDGLWIDMNEPANFGTNEERPWNWPEDYTPYWSLKCPQGPLDDPAYPTLAVTRYGKTSRLSEKTLCMIAKQKDGMYDHYDVHNLYGASQVASTLRALRNVTGERGIVVGRSTFVGSGHFVGHWLGDNFAEWWSMRMSIVGMLEFNLFGFPYIGADICGFFGDTTTNLCKRWLQLGAFYPYARSHNQIDSTVENDPGSFEDETLIQVTREAFRIRYTLLPYLYTLFHHANVRGNTVVRPLFHEFPRDKNTYGIDTQFLWGRSLLISPILEDDNTPSLTYYLPQARWFNYHTGLAEHYADKAGSEYTVDVKPDTQIPLHVRGGSIIPTQDYASNTQLSRQKPFHLLVYLDNQDGKAFGDLFWDDGVGIDTYENRKYYYAYYDCSDKIIRMRVQHNNVTELDQRYLEDVTVYGVSGRPVVVIVNGEFNHYDFDYDSSKQMLVVKKLQLSMNQPVDQEVTLNWGSSPLATAEEKMRIDCMPDWWRGVEDCEARGCIWAVAAPPSGIPRCYINTTSFGYRYKTNNPVVGISDSVSLEWAGDSSMFGGDFHNVTVTIEQKGDHVLRVKIAPTGVSRYEVPIPLNTVSGDTGTRDYDVEYETDPTQIFSFKIRRTSANTPIWDTSVGGMAVAEQFLQIVSRLPNMNVYGIGENEHHSFKHDFNFKTWPLFSRDQPPSYMGNLYGVHPYYLCVEDDQGRSHGVLLHNSNAMEIGFQPSPQINYRTVGGVLDFYYVFGDNPEMVTQRYTELIGRPYFPPYWSLGFQLCRYGYENIESLQAAVDRTIEAKIPYDVQYGDIDHFENNKDFTYDKVNFPGLPEYFQQLRDKGMRTIIILDPALLGVNVSYQPFTTGRDNDVFIKWPNGSNPQYDRFNNDYMYGYVWPEGEAVFPDFFLPRTHKWWEEWIVKWYNEGPPFDGLWIDMNEPANFDTNHDKPWNWPPGKDPWNLICPESQWDDPPYKPNSIWGPRLSDKTVCMVGIQSEGQFKQYDTHSLYGWSQSETTLSGLRNATGERGMVISRSTYPNSGSTVGHWLGDNASVWSHLYFSVIGMLEFNLFGIPYIGADICGYFNDATEEMCQRWTQLGAFYTFSRNHNGFGTRDQDPAAFGPEVAVSSRQALETRYTLLPYLYTLHYRAHVDGDTVIRPLLHEFITDKTARAIDRQFMWGSGLLVSPVLEQAQTSLLVYFPDCRWYDYYTGLKENHTGFQTVDAPLDFIPLHVRGGTIMPTQKYANTTHFSRQNPLGLIVAPDESNMAFGELFWDDGQSIMTITNQTFTLYTFEMSQSQLNATVLEIGFDIGLTLEEIRWFGVSPPKEIKLNIPSGNRLHQTWDYNPGTRELFVYDLQLPMDTSWSLELV